MGRDGLERWSIKMIRTGRGHNEVRFAHRLDGSKRVRQIEEEHCRQREHV